LSGLGITNPEESLEGKRGRERTRGGVCRGGSLVKRTKQRIKPLGKGSHGKRLGECTVKGVVGK